ncbi:LysR family transcriptional regulator [Kiloniella laminariae]|uniref:LysR family transcriptional regulator n=1 Tax=Kiloniella laminariae TaxID=454162 RepID=A0ABT4LP88_9PROT|nr:LysR family transcriptional regulator [Kiloniella laminariae]MCZ4282934.1 LysR family transcriptional regulator [Kiloniella laminariae]
MDHLASLSLFIRIVEKGGLASAGRDFGLSPAAVTERLASLEKHYNARLLNRTTRAISLTDEGRVLFEGARNLLSEATDLESRIRHGVAQLSGPIRLSAPIDLGRNRVAPLVDQFIEHHPEISVELCLSDGYIDLVAQGIDLALRFGSLKDSSLHSKKIGTNRRILCASPAYLARHPAPVHPDDLSEHNCLLMRFGMTTDREWPFVIDGKVKNYSVRGNRIANDGALVKHWCLLGHGLALKSQWDVELHLNKGELIPLLENFSAPENTLQIIYPGGKTLPKRVRTMIDFLARELDRGPGRSKQPFA